MLVASLHFLFLKNLSFGKKKKKKNTVVFSCDILMEWSLNHPFIHANHIQEQIISPFYVLAGICI